jgi:CubicO group peptidase (beta-lactamase class C family)
MNQFANVLTRIAGESIEALFKRRIADPISVSSWDWGDWGTVSGLLVNGGAGNKSKGIHITARQMARFGHLFLNRGNWDGTQLISSAWVDAASSVQVSNTVPANTSGADGPGVYGFNWWINGVKPNGQRRWPNAPDSMYAALGYNNNNCYVIPEWNMVVVRLGTDGSINASAWDGFFDRLADAITGTGNEGRPAAQAPILTVMPNPFNTAVVISIPDGHVGATRRVAPTVAIYDTHGRMVHVSNELNGNRYTWHTSDLPAGIYLVRIRMDQYSFSKKLVLTR